MSEPFLGEIRMVGFNFAPRGWLKADGQLLPIAQNSALFSLFGTIYGGDGRTTFALPDLRGRVPIHQGTGAGLTPRQIGSRSGGERTVLSVANIPSHQHSIGANTGEGTSDSPGSTSVMAKSSEGDSIYAVNATETMAPTGHTGGGQAFNNMQPFLTINFVVATVGLFPSRS